VTGNGNDLLKFLIQGLWDVALLQLVNATFRKGILLALSGLSSGGTMVLYLQKLVNFAPG
jgi:hypothetical protein